VNYILITIIVYKINNNIIYYNIVVIYRIDIIKMLNVSNRLIRYRIKDVQNICKIKRIIVVGLSFMFRLGYQMGVEL